MVIDFREMTIWHKRVDHDLRGIEIVKPTVNYEKSFSTLLRGIELVFLLCHGIAAENLPTPITPDP
jgi:hypothetical protein